MNLNTSLILFINAPRGRTAVLEEMVHRELRSLLDWIRTGRPLRLANAKPGDLAGGAGTREPGTLLWKVTKKTAFRPYYAKRGDTISRSRKQQRKNN